MERNRLSDRFSRSWPSFGRILLLAFRFCSETLCSSAEAAQQLPSAARVSFFCVVVLSHCWQKQKGTDKEHLLPLLPWSRLLGLLRQVHRRYPLIVGPATPFCVRGTDQRVADFETY